MKAPLLASILVAAGLVAGLAWYLAPRGPTPTPAVRLEPAPKASRPATRPQAEVDADRDAVARAFAIRLERALESPDEDPPLPTTQSRLEAEAAFEVVMSKLEDLADRDKPVSKRRRKRLYRAANDAFTALSGHLDSNDSRDMMTLEDAYSRLKHTLREVDAGPP